MLINVCSSVENGSEGRNTENGEKGEYLIKKNEGNAQNIGRIVWGKG